MDIFTTETLLCGCVYEENEWMLVRVKECEKHHKQRTRKREYRPKAECCRNDTRGEQFGFGIKFLVFYFIEPFAGKFNP